MELAETLNRTVKLAMDEGKAASYEDAERLFRSFRLKIAVAPGFTQAPAAQAAVLTLLNAARKTFLGGVELIGPLEERCTMAWFKGQSLAEVAAVFGINCGPQFGETPTIVVGDANPPVTGDFCLGIQLHAQGFVLEPGGSSGWEIAAGVEAGVAAAGAAINEAFQHVYCGWELAGQRRIRFDFAEGNRLPGKRSTWMVGLGHLGQAYLWTRALADAGRGGRIRLTDFDTVTLSSLSTCLMVDIGDVGRKKVDAVAGRLAQIGFDVVRDDSKLSLEEDVVAPDGSVVVIAVDNIGLRRGLDRIQGARIYECGIGDGIDGFTRVQMHAFPGSRLARDVWAGDDPRASRPVDISKPAYQALLGKSGDACGTTMVASRSVATPFVGAFAGAVLAHMGAREAQCDAWHFDLNCL